MDFQAISGNANANAGNANANANTNAKRNVGVAASFNYIVVDEGQDFTPCQAAVLYMVGVHGNEGNVSKGAIKKGAGARSGVRRSAKRALVVKKKWLDLILAGQKKWKSVAARRQSVVGFTSPRARLALMASQGKQAPCKYRTVTS